MPIYSFKCPNCGITVDKLRKMSDTSPVFCEANCLPVAGGTFKPEMEQVPAVPSPMQWGCKRF